MAEITISSVLRRSVRAQALGGRADNVTEAVKRAAFVYAAAPTCHLSVLARTRDYAPRQLDDAVMKSHDLIRLPAMRGSIYLIPREFVPHALALSQAVMRPVEHYAKLAGIEVRELKRLSERIEQIVSGKPRAATEIRAGLADNELSGGRLTLILGLMNRQGRLVRANVRGSARSQNYEYARMAEWITLPEERPTRAEALQTLAPYWLNANGPASVADFGWWAKVSNREAQAALEATGAHTITIPGLSGKLYATEAILDELASLPDGEDEAYLLPYWDSYLMAHKDRSRYLDEANRAHVVDRVGNVTNVILYGGRAAGIWDIEGKTLYYALFEPVPTPALEAAARRLAPLHDMRILTEVKNPPPLADGGQNGFMSPLLLPQKKLKN